MWTTRDVLKFRTLATCGDGIKDKVRPKVHYVKNSDLWVVSDFWAKTFLYYSSFPYITLDYDFDTW